MIVSCSKLFAVAICITSVAAKLSLPKCTNMTAPVQQVLDIPSFNLSVPSPPMGLVYACNDVAFTAMASGLGVLNTSASELELMHQISFPASLKHYPAGELAITKDKRTLYVPIGPGAVVLDVEKAIANANDSIIGMLGGTGVSAVKATLSADEDFVFITQEYGLNGTAIQAGAVEVYQLQRSYDGAVHGQIVGNITLGGAVVGMALSPDGSQLYVTSETAMDSKPGEDPMGSLSVLDVATLKKTPSKALVSFAHTSCGAVRVVASADGQHVWVTTRESNALLAFDANLLPSKPDEALEAVVQVGTGPVGLILVDHDRYVVVADSNRYLFANATTGLSVIDTEAALGGKHDGFPSLPTGGFPRGVALSPNGRQLLVAQYYSKAVESLDVDLVVKTVSGQY